MNNLNPFMKNCGVWYPACYVKDYTNNIYQFLILVTCQAMSCNVSLVTLLHGIAVTPSHGLPDFVLPGVHNQAVPCNVSPVTLLHGTAVTAPHYLISQFQKLCMTSQAMPCNVSPVTLLHDIAVARSQQESLHWHYS